MIKYKLKEMKAHGNLGFPIGGYEVKYKTGNQQILPCHWHEELELFYVSRGSAAFKVDNTTQTIHSGEAVIINGGELHSAYCYDPDGCDYYAVVFKLDFLESSESDLCQNKYINSLIMKKNKFINFVSTASDNTAFKKNIAFLLNNIINYNNERFDGYELALKGSLYLILSELWANKMIVPIYDVLKNNEQKIKSMKAVLKFIEVNFHKKITLEALSEKANLSKYHFCHFFKSYTGISPIDYLNMYRINEAAILLKSTDANITDVALQCGFDNMSHFINTFKKYKELSPSKYRKQTSI